MIDNITKNNSSQNDNVLDLMNDLFNVHKVVSKQTKNKYLKSNH
jgi:hypothetical protein